MRRYVLTMLLAAVMGFATLANANLIDNGGGLIYDADLNITWYDATPVARNWGDSMSWAAGLTVGGVGGWTLPTSDTVGGYNCIDSQMGHIYYTELNDGLGLTAGFGNGVTPSNQSPFTKLQPYYYWSGTEYADNPTMAWAFNFQDGLQLMSYKNPNGFFALAVHSGNVVAPVPEPCAVWLLGSGLIGLVGLRRKFKK